MATITRMQKRKRTAEQHAPVKKMSRSKASSSTTSKPSPSKPTSGHTGKQPALPSKKDAKKVTFQDKQTDRPKKVSKNKGNQARDDRKLGSGSNPYSFMTDYKEAADTYHKTIISKALTALDEGFNALKATLEQPHAPVAGNQASPGGDGSGSGEGDDDNDLLSCLLRPLETPLEDQVIRISSRTSGHIQTTVGERISKFQNLLEREHGKLRDLAGQHEEVMHELYWLCVAATGKERVDEKVHWAGKASILATAAASTMAMPDKADNTTDSTTPGNQTKPAGNGLESILKSTSNPTAKLHKPYGSVPSTLSPLPPLFLSLDNGSASSVSNKAEIARLREEIKTLGDEDFARLQEEEKDRSRKMKSSNKAIVKAMKEFWN